MRYKCQKKISNRAEKVIKNLEEYKIKAEIKMFRDYLAKIAVKYQGRNSGNLNLYYKPSKDKFNLKKHELTDEKLVEYLSTISDSQLLEDNKKSEKYLHQDKLKEKAMEFSSLLADHQIKATIKMFRDHLVKMRVRYKGQNYGNFNLYYSTTNDRFKLVTNELKDDNLVQDIEKAWNQGDLLETTINGNLSTTPARQLEGSNNLLYKAYTDGSYMNNKIGYGAVILKEDKVIEEISDQLTLEGMNKFRQVGGEIYAIIEVLKWCQNHNIDQIGLYYDLKNLKYWATGEWKRNNSLTKKYKKFIDNCEVDIVWNKVKAHSGCKYNEQADKLAKAAIQ